MSSLPKANSANVVRRLKEIIYNKFAKIARVLLTVDPSKTYSRFLDPAEHLSLFGYGREMAKRNSKVIR